MAGRTAVAFALVVAASACGGGTGERAAPRDEVVEALLDDGGEASGSGVDPDDGRVSAEELETIRELLFDREYYSIAGAINLSSANALAEGMCEMARSAESFVEWQLSILTAIAAADLDELAVGDDEDWPLVVSGFVAAAACGARATELAQER